MTTQYALVVMCETGEANPGGQGRMLHVLKTAKEFKAAGIPVGIFFHGIGVQWLTAFDERADRFTQVYGPLFDEVRDTIGGACHFCAATRFGAGTAADHLAIPLLGQPGDHHTVAALIAAGYQPIIF
jgi:hypothetical protein